jgi:hypothetical protein
MVEAGVAMKKTERSAAEGVELFICLYDSVYNLCFVLVLCDVDVRSQVFVLS